MESFFTNNLYTIKVFCAIITAVGIIAALYNSYKRIELHQGYRFENSGITEVYVDRKTESVVKPNDDYTYPPG